MAVSAHRQPEDRQPDDQPIATEPLVGRRVRRKEDRRFVTGQGRFVDDIQLPGMTHGVVLRSPHAHARLVRLDVGAAAAT